MKCKYSRESRSELWWERKSDVYTTAQRVCVERRGLWSAPSSSSFCARYCLCRTNHPLWLPDPDQFHLNAVYCENTTIDTTKKHFLLTESLDLSLLKRNQCPAAKRMSAASVCVSLILQDESPTAVWRVNNQNLLRQLEGKAPHPVRRQIECGTYKFTFILAVWLPSTAKCGVMAARQGPCR